jgi:tetratricopeptide (TPR) repeat protein
LAISISVIPLSHAGDNPVDWNVILQEYRSQKDSERLTHSFDSLIRNANKKEKESLKIIYKTLLAELHFNAQDHKNEQSEQLFANAYALAQQSKNIALQIWTTTQYGYYYYTNSDYLAALPYFLETSRALESYPHDLIPEVNTVFIKHAYYYGTMDDHELSIKFLEKALVLSSENSQEYGAILFALGGMYIKTNDIETAEKYLLQTLHAAQNSSDKIRNAKALGELALIHHQRGDSEQAVDFLLKDIELSEKYGDKRNAMYAQLQLGRIYYELGDIDKSQNLLYTALQHAKSRAYLKGFEKEIVEIQLKIAEKQNDEARELALRRDLDDINQHISITDGQEIINKVNWQTQKERIQWQLDTKKAKLERSSLIKWIWAIVSVFLSFILFLLYKVSRKKLKLQQLIFERKIFSFELEKVRSEKALTDTRSSLASFQVYLEEKNQQLEQLENEIYKITNSSNDKLQEQRVSLERLLDSHLMTDESWAQFKAAFIKDKEDFYNGIVSRLPGLTESNLRIVLLQNLGLNNQQVAQLLGVTIDAVKKSKQRMRKKYGDQFDEITLNQTYLVAIDSP